MRTVNTLSDHTTSNQCFSQAASDCLSDCDFYYNMEWFLSNLNDQVFGMKGTTDDFIMAHNVHNKIAEDFLGSPSKYQSVLHLINASREMLQMPVLGATPQRVLELH